MSILERLKITRRTFQLVASEWRMLANDNEFALGMVQLDFAIHALEQERRVPPPGPAPLEPPCLSRPLNY